jgi:hypothetical protein
MCDKGSQHGINVQATSRPGKSLDAPDSIWNLISSSPQPSSQRVKGVVNGSTPGLVATGNSCPPASDCYRFALSDPSVDVK